MKGTRDDGWLDVDQPCQIGLRFRLLPIHPKPHLYAASPLSLSQWREHSSQAVQLSQHRHRKRRENPRPTIQSSTHHHLLLLIPSPWTPSCTISSISLKRPPPLSTHLNQPIKIPTFLLCASLRPQFTAKRHLRRRAHGSPSAKMVFCSCGTLAWASFPAQASLCLDPSSNSLLLIWCPCWNPKKMRFLAWIGSAS